MAKFKLTLFLFCLILLIPTGFGIYAVMTGQPIEQVYGRVFGSAFGIKFFPPNTPQNPLDLPTSGNSSEPPIDVLDRSDEAYDNLLKEMEREDAIRRQRQVEGVQKFREEWKGINEDLDRLNIN